MPSWVRPKLETISWQQFEYVEADCGGSENETYALTRVALYVEFLLFLLAQLLQSKSRAIFFDDYVMSTVLAAS